MSAPLDRISRLLRTVAYLKPGQVFNRLWRRILPAPNVAGPTPAVRSPASTYSACPGRPRTMTGPQSFEFLGHEGTVTAPAQWNDPAQAKLWLYNLHYFDDLHAVAANERQEWHRALIKRWIAENPPLRGNGWEPYVLSRRIVNWVAWHLAGNNLDPEAIASLAMQGRALRGQLEYHLLGNHLFANAKALVFIGCLFSGREADEWQETGLAILARELDEQILADGAHFELSPMYHAIILEDLLDLVQLAAIYPDLLARHASQQGWGRRAQAMLHWLETMSHPDGEIGFFNDAALGQARNHAELAGYSAALGIPQTPRETVSEHLAASGYARLERGEWVVLMDMAEVGPTYIPGHAHADTLSLEISCGGARLVTNGGTSTYAPGPVREAERGTASHATVCIDNENSSETWASFRVGRRARIVSARVAGDAERDIAEAAHDGYRHLQGAPVHRRIVEASADKVTVRDLYQAKAAHTVTGRFPLHPSVRVSAMDETGWTLVAGDGKKIKVSLSGPVKAGLDETTYGECFGVRTPRQVLVWTAENCRSTEVAMEFSC